MMPSFMDREILQTRNSNVIFGLGLGSSHGCESHVIKDMDEYVNRFMLFTRRRTCATAKFLTDRAESINRMVHWGYLTDGTQFEEASKYLLPDRLGYVESSITLHHRSHKNKFLVEGDYYVIVIEGFDHRGFGKRWIDKSGLRGHVYEEDVIYHRSLCKNGTPERFISLWGISFGSIALLVNKNMYSVRDMIHDSLVGGHLALGYGLYSPGLNLICVDRLVKSCGSTIFDS